MSRTFRRKEDKYKYKKRSARKPWEDGDQEARGADEKVRREQERRARRRESTEREPSDD